MAYHVKIDSFEGPFELLLALVTQQKVKIGSISISEVADQYMAYIQEMHDLDMDVASEFLMVASTLLAMKAQALLPAAPAKSNDADEEELTLEQATDLLATRIIVYYQYKRLAAMLGSRMRNEAMSFTRIAGLDKEFLGLIPDYLEGVTLEGLGLVCASLMTKREVFLLDAEHIAAKPISVDEYVDTIEHKLKDKKKMTFDEVIAEAKDAAHIVVSFLAILEMYKRGMIDLKQDAPGNPIDIKYNDPDKWAQYAALDVAGEVSGVDTNAENNSNSEAMSDDAGSNVYSSTDVGEDVVVDAEESENAVEDGEDINDDAAVEDDVDE